MSLKFLPVLRVDPFSSGGPTRSRVADRSCSTSTLPRPLFPPTAPLLLLLIILHSLSKRSRETTTVALVVICIGNSGAENGREEEEKVA